MTKSTSILAILVIALCACSKAPEPAEPGAAGGAAEPVAPTPAPAPPPASSPEPATASPDDDASDDGADPSVASPLESVSPALPVPPDEAANDEPVNHIVKGVVTQWRPLVLFANPGDSVTFTTMTGHDTQSLDGLIPEGAEPWRSELGAEGFTVTLPVPGAYVYKCNPHITTGMVGVFIVGDPAAVDLDQLLEAANSVKVGRNMVQRAIRKAKKALPAQ